MNFYFHHFLFTIEHVIVWTNFFLFTSSMSCWFFNVVHPPMKAFLAHPCLGFPHVLHFHHPLNFTSIICLTNGAAFTSFTCPEIQQLVFVVQRLDNLHLSLGKTFPTFTRPKIGLFWLVIFLPMNFDYSHVHALSRLFLG